MKRNLFFLAFILSILVLGMNTIILGEGPETSSIVSFEPLKDNYIALDDKLSEEDLTAQFPGCITGFTGTGEKISIEVSWNTETDYSSTDATYYLFWPEWDTSAFPLGESFDHEDYVPFVEVVIGSPASQVNHEKGNKKYLRGTKSLSSGIKNIVARAHQQVNIQWTPKLTVNGFKDSSGSLTGIFYAGTTYTGIPYGQLINSGRYVPHGASFDTFLNAVNNPSSVFYTTRGSYGSLESTYYGSDCSAFVSYAYGLPRMTTSTIASSGRFQAVSGNSIYNAEVGDCFNRAGYHVELITGMTYDGNGNLTQVEVSEQTPPKAVTRVYSPSEVQSIISKGYTLLRFTGRDEVGAPDTYNGYAGEAAQDNSPEGQFDEVAVDIGTLYVNGWAYDPNKKDQAIDVYIGVGGVPGSSGVETHVLRADRFRSDVHSATGAGEYHGFEDTLDTVRYGEQTIYAYGINVDSSGAVAESGNKQLGNSPKTITIPKPTPETLSPSAILTYNGNTYERYDKAMTWSDAKAFCEARGGHLVTISSSDENFQVSGFASQGTKNYYAIGAESQGSKGTWRWVTGEELNYANWDMQSVEGNTDGEEYAFIIGKDNSPNKQVGEWIDNPDDLEDGNTLGFYHQVNSGFICEFEKKCDHIYRYSVKQTPGENKTGRLEGVCGNCGDIVNVELPVLNTEDYEYTVTKEPTCTSTGTGTYYWKKTGNQIFAFTGQLPKTEHDYDVTENAPTCIDSGSVTYTCRVCGYTYTENLPETEDGWTEEKPVGIPDDQIQTKMQYRYSDYDTTTSYDTYLPGYTEKSSDWEQSGNGSVQYVQSWPSGFNTGYGLYGTYNKSPRSDLETATEKTKVNSNSVCGYIYYHWCRGTYVDGPINRGTRTYQTGEFNAFHAFYSTADPSTLTASPDGDGSCIHSNASVCKDSYWYYNIPVYNQTYTTYRKLFTYERWTDWSEWSDTEYTASSTRRVETRTVYKYEADIDSRHRWGAPVYTWNEGTDTLSAEYTCELDSSHKKTETLENLNVLRLPAGLEIIEEEAFEGTASQVIIIPEGCTTIGARAFANCPELLYVVLPDSVTNVAENALEGSTKADF